MSLESWRLGQAAADKATIASIKENFRNHLLTALSEARLASASIEGRIREQLMDDLGEYFHPDGRVSDCFADGFHNAETMADDEVETRRDELQAAE